MSEMQDVQIDCAVPGCGKFTFSVGEQQFIENRTDSKTGRPWVFPRRCKKHRDDMKKVREEAKARNAQKPDAPKRQGDSALGL